MTENVHKYDVNGDNHVEFLDSSSRKRTNDGVQSKFGEYDGTLP